MSHYFTLLSLCQDQNYADAGTKKKQGLKRPRKYETKISIMFKLDIKFTQFSNGTFFIH